MLRGIFRRKRRRRNNYVRDLTDIYIAERDKLFGDTMPEIEFTFCFAAHVDAEDASILADVLPDTDIYLPEFSEWSTFSEEMYEFVTKGIMKPIDVIAKNVRDRHAYVTERFVQMTGCGAVVRMIDIPEGHPLADADVLDVDAFRSREAYIVRSIPRALKSAFDANPALAELGRPVRVAISYGSLHTQLSMALRFAGENVQRTFSEQPYVFPRMARKRRRDVFFGQYEEIRVIDAWTHL